MEEKERCKEYTQATGRYSSFYKGEQCKRRAVIDGYCKQHSKPT